MQNNGNRLEGVKGWFLHILVVSIKLTPGVFSEFDSFKWCCETIVGQFFWRSSPPVHLFLAYSHHWKIPSCLTRKIHLLANSKQQTWLSGCCSHLLASETKNANWNNVTSSQWRRDPSCQPQMMEQHGRTSVRGLRERLTCPHYIWRVIAVLIGIKYTYTSILSCWTRYLLYISTVSTQFVLTCLDFSLKNGPFPHMKSSSSSCCEWKLLQKRLLDGPNPTTTYQPHWSAMGELVKSPGQVTNELHPKAMYSCFDGQRIKDLPVNHD